MMQRSRQIAVDAYIVGYGRDQRVKTAFQAGKEGTPTVAVHTDEFSHFIGHLFRIANDITGVFDDGPNGGHELVPRVAKLGRLQFTGIGDKSGILIIYPADFPSFIRIFVGL